MKTFRMGPTGFYNVRWLRPGLMPLPCHTTRMPSSPRLAVALSAQQTQTPPKTAPANPHVQLNMRGAEVMGFDQNKTTHHF